MSIAFHRKVRRQHRRAVLALACGLLAAPLAALAQRTTWRYAALLQGSPPGPGASLWRPVTRALEELGYVEGQNLFVDRLWAEGDPGRFPRLAAEAVALKPDVILSETTPGSLAAKRATTTIPIVMFNVTDPVATGLVASLAHPGGNVTGIADLGSETAVQGLDLIRAVVPGASRIAVLMSDNPAQLVQLQHLQAAAKTAGFALLPTVAKSSEEFDSAFQSMTSSKAGAVLVLGDVQFGTPRHSARLAELAMQAKLPMLTQNGRGVTLGGLMSYGPASVAKYVAHYIDKIFRGANPGDLPVQRPTEFVLTINLKTARLLGLAIPQSVLLRATAIIE